MKPVQIFRHVDCEGPGYLADVLDQHQIPFQIIAVDQGASIPESVDDVAGLVFMGGPMSVNDALSWIDPELRLIRKACKAGRPVLGHCLGGQLIAKALGASVSPNPVPEIGWHAVNQCSTGAAADWLNGLPETFDAFHWHSESFTLPTGAAPLLESQWCDHQAFVAGPMLALQCHTEMTAPMVREWSQRYQDQLNQPSASVQSAELILTDLETRLHQLQGVANVLYQRWLTPLLSA